LTDPTLSDDNLVVGFIDPSTSVEVPGWPLRNLILAVAKHRSGQRRFLAFRDVHLSSRANAVPCSRVFVVNALPGHADFTLVSPPPPEVQFAGWSKIQTFDLTAFLDKKRMASDAVDLNIKLMKWRLIPDLDPSRMKNLKFLLLGAGTLGCSVARSLMGWGVRRMTFVDSGRVSLSNPVRQSLFTHSDAAEGRPKAQAARHCVEAILPDAEVQDVELEIPMPGHKHQSSAVLRQRVAQLDQLIGSHDVVCMLTDSRESRWLPSLMVASRQKDHQSQSDESHQHLPPLGITVALGFDSFLVSRQTYRSSTSACYFCNDVTAPSDSIAFRTLDQQCTVTRPGLSGIASSIAVELIAALAQHHDGFQAGSTCTASGDVGQAAVSPLGAVPHQIRGYLAEFRLAPAETEPFSKCISCSPAVLDQYVKQGCCFVERITENSSELEEISGLAGMKAAVREDEVLSFDEFDDDT